MRTMSLSKSTAQNASRRRASTRRTAPTGATNKSLSTAPTTNVGKRRGDKRPRENTETKRLKRDPGTGTVPTIYLSDDGVRPRIVARNNRPVVLTRLRTRPNTETTSIIVVTIGLLLALLFAATIYSFGAAIRSR
ncbi:m13 protein [Murid betaherpesvirus 1]|nr:m13 protein [Murid betaherpesvirus 1]